MIVPEQPENDVPSTFMVGVVLTFIGYILGSMNAAAGSSISIGAIIMGVVFALLVALDVEQLQSHGIEWGLTRWIYYLATLIFPPTVIVYYVRRRKRIEKKFGPRGQPA